MKSIVQNTNQRRGTPYSLEVVERVLLELRSGRSLTSICKEDWAPNISTFLRWEKDDRDQLSDRYARARRIGWEILADEILDIADDASEDVIIDDSGRQVFNRERVQRDRLRIDTRKWILSKRIPEVFDKPEIKSDGQAQIHVIEVVKPQGAEGN